MGKINKLANYRASYRLFRTYQNIFLFSHMRANTSLLSHIIGNNPEINGYYESHNNYFSKKDIFKSKFEYTTDHHLKKRSKFFFDKLLHNELQVSNEIIENNNNKVIFSLREPKATVNSIVKLYRNNKTESQFSSINGAAQYYIDRLHRLKELSSLPKYCFYLDAEILRTNPEHLLEELSKFLNLQVKLTSKFGIQPYTGKSGVGDPSGNLSHGRIIPKGNDEPHSPLNTGLERELKIVYEHVRCNLIRNATVSISF